MSFFLKTQIPRVILQSSSCLLTISISLLHVTNIFPDVTTESTGYSEANAFFLSLEKVPRPQSAAYMTHILRTGHFHSSDIMSVSSSSTFSLLIISFAPCDQHTPPLIDCFLHPSMLHTRLTLGLFTMPCFSSLAFIALFSRSNQLARSSAILARASACPSALPLYHIARSWNHLSIGANHIFQFGIHCRSR